MKKQELQILAMVECLVLWDYLAKTGCSSKFKAIDLLFADGKLSGRVYADGCPFCTHLMDDKLVFICSWCLWPGHKRSASRCCDYGSPFKEWLNAKTKSQHKKAAAKVLEMLKQIPMD